MAENPKPKVKGVADVVFLIDVSGSMQPCIDSLQKNIATFVKFCREPDENQGVAVKDLRIKVCGYRDHTADGETWFQSSPFVIVTDSVAPLEAHLASLQARGGGDEPESLLDALFKVGSMGESGAQDEADPERWRRRARRMVIAFTDATYHPTITAEEGNGGNWESVGQLLMGKKIKLVLFAPKAACYEDLAAIDGSIVEFYTENLATAPDDLQRITSDRSAFRRTLESLAKTVSVSAEVEKL